ncbi:homeobox protein ATH1-like [Telopea speciosissima]|uniref:homeobox protein ATH1-like n=1 Tax=Telopea speciosissima TaxID=54955 RepID=UPI001CC7687E|nr:homeobox protein ATH1-like [Telopea speciosissima]
MYNSSLVSHCRMENDIINTSSEISDRNPMVLDRIPSTLLSDAFVQSDSLVFNSRSQIIAGYPLLPTLQGDQINDIQDDFPETNRGGIIGSDATASRNMLLHHRLATRNASVSSLHPVNSDFQEQFSGRASLSAMSLPNILETTSTLQKNLDRVTVSAPSTFQLEDLRTFISNGCDNSNSSLTGSVNGDYSRGHGDMEFMAPKDCSLPGELDGKWDFEKFLDCQELSVKNPMRMISDPYDVGSSGPNFWISSNKSNFSADGSCSYFIPCNELSLSLATCQPSITSLPTIPDQCSEISCSGFTRHSLHEVGLATGLSSEQTCSKSSELSLSYGSCKPFHFSHILSGSKYLHVAQQILTEIASYSVENQGNFSYSPGTIGTGAKISFSSECSGVGEISLESDESSYPAGNARSEDQMEFTLQRQEIEVKKGQLLALLQLIDNRYNQCLDEIHTVVSAFHAATELDPQIHARFILQTISLPYNNLRERITNQIIAIGGRLSSGHNREERSFKSSFIQKQWALEQLKRREYQSWRPQRGLPERSVSVLRAWMFQNFLHPYPKDAEKHLLAIKSGLTRSQVSNWFINARVRLWKPMIEEMYSEMNMTKGLWNGEGTNIVHMNHLRIEDQRTQMN